MLPGVGRVDLLTRTLRQFVLDYVARQKIAGTHLKYFIVKQLPVLPPDVYYELGALARRCIASRLDPSSVFSS